MLENQDKLAQFNYIKKNINKLCHDQCFKQIVSPLSKDLTYYLDNKCAKICYEKYLKVADLVLKESIILGKESKSEVIHKLYKPNRDFYREKLIFPEGGVKRRQPFFFFGNKFYNKSVPHFIDKGLNEFIPEEHNR